MTDGPTTYSYVFRIGHFWPGVSDWWSDGVEAGIGVFSSSAGARAAWQPQYRTIYQDHFSPGNAGVSAVVRSPILTVLATTAKSWVETRRRYAQAARTVSSHRFCSLRVLSIVQFWFDTLL